MAETIQILLQRPQAVIMGVVNVTPDSFSDGGNFFKPVAAVSHALQLVDEGADILDIGGESTRPGAESVSLQQELDRVITVIEGVSQETDTPISIDTTKPEVMEAAVKAGAELVNDINALRSEGAIQVIADLGVSVCLVHMQGEPRTMQKNIEYADVVADVKTYLQKRKKACVEGGIAPNDIILDPGIGFGKTLSHNLALLKAVPEFIVDLDCEVLIGVSRKSMIDGLLHRPVNERLPASIGLAVQAVLNGAKILRVHDVQASYDAVRSVEAVLNA